MTLRVVMADLKQEPQYCNRGAREMCERYGFDWWDFKVNGIEADRLLEIDNAMVTELVERAKRRTQGQNNG